MQNVSSEAQLQGKDWLVMKEEDATASAAAWHPADTGTGILEDLPRRPNSHPLLTSAGWCSFKVSGQAPV